MKPQFDNFYTRSAVFFKHLMRRIQAGPVRGISLAMQEERRERRLDYTPNESALEPTHEKSVGPVVKAMIDDIGVPVSGILPLDGGHK